MTVCTLCHIVSCEQLFYPHVHSFPIIRVAIPTHLHPGCPHVHHGVNRHRFARAQRSWGFLPNLSFQFPVLIAISPSWKQIYNFLTLASTQHGNTLRIKNTGSTSCKPLHSSLGHARDDNDYMPIPTLLAKCFSLFSWHHHGYRVLKLLSHRHATLCCECSFCNLFYKKSSCFNVFKMFAIGLRAITPLLYYAIGKLLSYYTVSQKKTAQLWNGIARNCNDRFWCYLAEIFKSI